jgi:ribosomal protein S18 acetylase RimI-like enzyme
VSTSGSQPRPARPADYDVIATAVDGWWGRPILAALPRLFLDHFHRTSLVIDEPAGLVAFLIGILSPAEPDQAYIHFAGVAPHARRHGLARLLYTEFFAMARADGRSTVSAVTAPVNTGSISFHRAMGFAVTGPVPGYNGPGQDLMVFTRAL